MFMAAGNKSSGYQIGQLLQGGYFAGYISHTANGVATHALIVAPRATGASGTNYPVTTNYQWKTTQTLTGGATSLYDGSANTSALIAAGAANHPAAQFCKNLSIGGYTDWYLPAISEIEIAYYNLKPTTNSNNTSFGINDYSVFKRTSNYTSTWPAQTTVTAFKSTGSETFSTIGHWISTEEDVINTRQFGFAAGIHNLITKNGSIAVRAFRRIAV